MRAHLDFEDIRPASAGGYRRTEGTSSRPTTAQVLGLAGLFGILCGLMVVAPGELTSFITHLSLAGADVGLVAGMSAAAWFTWRRLRGSSPVVAALVTCAVGLGLVQPLDSGESPTHPLGGKMAAVIHHQHPGRAANSVSARQGASTQGGRSSSELASSSVSSPSNSERSFVQTNLPSSAATQPTQRISSTPGAAPTSQNVPTGGNSTSAASSGSYQSGGSSSEGSGSGTSYTGPSTPSPASTSTGMASGSTSSTSTSSGADSSGSSLSATSQGVNMTNGSSSMSVGGS